MKDLQRNIIQGNAFIHFLFPMHRIPSVIIIADKDARSISVQAFKGKRIKAYVHGGVLFGVASLGYLMLLLLLF
jgi:hypothetical protein